MISYNVKFTVRIHPTNLAWIFGLISCIYNLTYVICPPIHRIIYYFGCRNVTFVVFPLAYEQYFRGVEGFPQAYEKTPQKHADCHGHLWWFWRSNNFELKFAILVPLTFWAVLYHHTHSLIFVQYQERCSELPLWACRGESESGGCTDSRWLHV